MTADRAEASDAELLERAAGGNADAFSTLMRKHEDKVFGLALRMLGNRSDALDATQDAFIAAYRQAGSFRGDAAVGTWLYRIGANACKDLLRKRKRWVSQDEATLEPLHVESGPSVEASVTDRVVVRDALAQLPEEYRDAVVLHDLGGITYEEIARITETNIGTVKSRISRGRRRLADLLEHPAGPEPSKEVT